MGLSAFSHLWTTAYSCLVMDGFCPLQPLVNRFVWCLIVCAVVLMQALLQHAKQVKIWCSTLRCGRCASEWLMCCELWPLFKQYLNNIASPWPCQATHVCAQLRQSQNLNGQCSYINVTVLTPNHQIFASFVFFKNTGYSSLAQMPRHCRIPYTSGCR
jgi:hypothetical protein